MTEINAYYAHESGVGPVFDVAHFSPGRALWMGIVGLGFTAVVAVAAVFVWNPYWIVPRPPDWFFDGNREVLDLARQHPLGVQIGVAVAMLFVLLFAAASLSALLTALSADYYIRVGENGLALRVPAGFFSSFECELAWDEIASLTVVQEKYIGSMSRNAGNCGGELRLRTHTGLDQNLRLDLFREDAWLIHQRIEEAMNTRPAVLV